MDLIRNIVSCENETCSSDLNMQPPILELTGGFKQGPELSLVSPIYPGLCNLPVARSFRAGELCPLYCGCHGAEEKKSIFIKKHFHAGSHAGSALDN